MSFDRDFGARMVPAPYNRSGMPQKRSSQHLNEPAERGAVKRPNVAGESWIQGNFDFTTAETSAAEIGTFPDPVQNRLNNMLGVRAGEVPAYVLRMRERGLTGYPPAYLDQFVRVNSSIPLFSESVEDVFPRRTVQKDKLPAYSGYTHTYGDSVSDNLCQALQNLADADYELTTERFKSDSEQYALCQSTEFVKEKPEEYSRTEIPEHTPDGDGGYAFAKETRHLKHDINSFSKGIQPFAHRELTPKTGFLKKLTSILKRKSKKSDDNKEEEIRL